MRDEDSEVRARAAAAINLLFLNGSQRFGTRAEALVSAVPQLTQLLKDPNERVRRFAAQALTFLAPPTPDSATSAVAMLGDASPDVRRQAVWLLRRLGPLTPEVIPSLLGVVRVDDDPIIRQIATRGLLAFAQFDPGIAKQMSGLASDHSALGRADIIGLLPHLRRTVEVEGRLIEFFRDPTERADVRVASVRALGELSSVQQTAEVREMLSQVLGNAAEDEDVRAAVPVVLARFTSPGDRLEIFARALRDRKASVRKSAAAGLRRLHARGERALEVLVEAAKESDPTVQENAIRAIGSIGPSARAALPTLEKLAAGGEKPPAVSLAIRSAIDSIAGKAPEM